VGSALNAGKFDKRKSMDELYLWSQQRDYRLALANVSTARSLNPSSFTAGSSLWAWDPWLGSFTFLPGSGRIYSPFGLSWYSPQTVWIAFQPPPSPSTDYSASNSGWQGTSPSSYSSAPSANTSTGAVSAPATSSSSAVAAGASAARGR
jgi:hypothetical protein